MIHARKSELSRLRPQSWPLRLFHGLNLFLLIIMIGSGLQIYNANPVFGGRGGVAIPAVFTLGGWLAGGRDWHFAGMNLYILNLLGWFGFMLSQRRRRLANQKDLSRLTHEFGPQYRASLHRVVYTLLLLLLLLPVLSGVAMYKPAQLWWLTHFFGDWQTLRTIHFLAVPMFLGLGFWHVRLALGLGGIRLLRSMFF